MKIENIINILLERFPEIQEAYEEEKEFIENMPHYVCESIFVKYIVKICRNFNIEKINQISDFLEEMAQCDDEMINNLFGVSIIEPLLYEPEILKILRKYLKEKTIQELTMMENWKPTPEMLNLDIYSLYNKKNKS